MDFDAQYDEDLIPSFDYDNEYDGDFDEDVSYDANSYYDADGDYDGDADYDASGRKKKHGHGRHHGGGCRRPVRHPSDAVLYKPTTGLVYLGGNFAWGGCRRSFGCRCGCQKPRKPTCFKKPQYKPKKQCFKVCI